MDEFDDDILAEIHEIDPATFREVTTSFCSSWPTTRASLQDSLAAGDSTSLYTQAHRLKGGSRTLGLMGVGRICQQLEAGAQAGRLDQAQDLLDELDTACDRALAHLQDLQQNPAF